MSVIYTSIFNNTYSVGQAHSGKPLGERSAVVVASDVSNHGTENPFDAIIKRVASIKFPSVDKVNRYRALEVPHNKVALRCDKVAPAPPSKIPILKRTGVYTQRVLSTGGPANATDCYKPYSAWTCANRYATQRVAVLYSRLLSSLPKAPEAAVPTRSNKKTVASMIRSPRVPFTPVRNTRAPPVVCLRRRVYNKIIETSDMSFEDSDDTPFDISELGL